MEFASLEDAFPETEKKEKRRKEKRKEGFQAYELPPTDPDRPAVKRMQEIPPVNASTHCDKENEFLDQASIFAKKSTVNNSLPKPRSILKLQAEETPNFFGAEPFSNPSEDTLAIYNGTSTKSTGYMLEADFTKSFDDTGFGKSAGSAVPIPELRQRWKPMSAERIDTSFTSGNKDSQFDGLSTDDIQAMRSKIDVLMARLDDLENRGEGASPQLEMLSFIMTGLFLMFALDLTVRRVSQ